MVTPTVTVYNLRDARGKFAHATEQVAQRAEEIIIEALDIAQTALRAHAPRGKSDPVDSLRENILIVAPRLEGSRIVGGISLPQKALYTLPPGTVPHQIPVGGSAEQMGKGYPLVFFWEAVGTTVYRWSVQHPGYQPDTDWAADAMAETRTQVLGQLSRTGKSLLEGF